MFVFAEDGDTAAKITYDCLGYNDADFAEKVYRGNLNSTAWQAFPSCNLYAGNRPVWVPLGYDRMCPKERDLILDRFDFITSDARANLADMQKDGVDLTHMVGVGYASWHHNQREKHHYADKVAELSASAGGLLEGPRLLAERSGGYGEHFSESINQLNDTIAKVRRGEGDVTEVKHLAQESLGHLQKAGLYFKSAHAQKLNQVLDSDYSVMRSMVRKGFQVVDLDGVEVLEKIGKTAHRLKVGGWVTTTVLSGVELGADYAQKVRTNIAPTILTL
jgi:hypothetical protein